MRRACCNTVEESHVPIKLKHAKPSVLLHRNYQVLRDLRSKSEGRHARSQHLVMGCEVVLTVAVCATLVLAVHLPSCSSVFNGACEDVGRDPARQACLVGF